MMSKIRAIPPFDIPGQNSIALDPVAGWEVSVDAGQTFSTIKNKGEFPSWDSALEFILRRRFRINAGELAAATGLTGANPKFSLVTKLTTGSGRLSVVYPIQEVRDYRDDHEVILHPVSGLLSQDIVLQSSIVLTGFIGIPGSLAPNFRGAVLWVDEWRTKLEGGLQRLPGEPVPFSTYFRDGSCANALIRVAVVEDPSLDFSQAVCAYINSEVPKFVNAFREGNPAARAFFFETVLRQLISYGLSEAFSDNHTDLSEDSVGKQLLFLVRLVFGNESLESIREMRKQNPGLYESRIQSKAITGSRWLQESAP